MKYRTDRDDVILAEAQLIIIVALKVKQGLGTPPPIPGHIDVVLQVQGMALHVVVSNQVLHALRTTL